MGHLIIVAIWRKAQKDTFVARRTLEVVVAYADGGCGILKVTEKCGFPDGHCTIMGLAESNKVRINSMNCKTSVNCKLRRKKLRAYRKNWEDKESEDNSYSSGAF